MKNRRLSGILKFGQAVLLVHGLGLASSPGEGAGPPLEPIWERASRATSPGQWSMLLEAGLEALLHCQGIDLLGVFQVLGNLRDLPSKKVLGAGVELLHLLPGTFLLLHSLEVYAPKNKAS